MVPSAFVVLDALPLTPNGKLDRRRCRRPRSARASAARRRARRRKRSLCGLFAEVLRLERVGIDDDFFDARRPLAAGDAADRPHPRHAGRRAADPRPVRGADRRGAGRAGWPRRGGAPGPRWLRAPRRRRSRCRSRSGGCGSSTGSTARARPTTIPWPCGCTGALDVAALGGARRCGGAAREPAHGVPGHAGVPRQHIVDASGRAAATAGRAVTEADARQRRWRRRLARGFDLATRDAAARACCSRLRRTSTCCCCCSTTSPATAGRSRRCARDLGDAYAARCRGAPRSCRRCRCSTRTTRCGSMRLLGDESDPDSADRAPAGVLAEALAGLPDQLDAADRPAAAGGARAIAATPCRSPSARSCTAASLQLARERRRACSWCCRPALRRC